MCLPDTPGACDMRMDTGRAPIASGHAYLPERLRARWRFFAARLRVPA